jgi:hypothetical protein
MPKITTIAATVALVFTGAPVVSTAAAATRHKDPIAHIASSSKAHRSVGHLARRGHKGGRPVAVTAGPR